MLVTHLDTAFDLPLDWQDATDITLLGPGAAGVYRPSILMSRLALEKPSTAAEYAAQQEPELQKLIGDDAFRLREQGEFVVGGLTAYRVIYTLRIPDQPPIRQMQVYIPRGKVIHLITCSDLPDHFLRARPLFEAVIASLRFTKIYGL